MRSTRLLLRSLLAFDKRTPAGLAALFASVIPIAMSGACGGETTDANGEQDAGSSGGGGSSSGGSSGDGGSGDGGVVPTYASPLCDDGRYEMFAGLNLATPTDYLEYRSVYEGSEGTPNVIASLGEKCSGASDQAACLAKYDAIAVVEGFETLADYEPLIGERPQGTTYLVYTRGDDVRSVATQAELDALLGSFDTLKEAALQLVVRNQQIVCAPTTPHSTGESIGTTAAPSFRLVTFAGFACGEGTSRDALITRVDGAGARTLESRTVLERGDNACAVGRRPDGLHASRSQGEGMGAFFAEIAHLEAASVTAFAQIEAELRLFDAPRSLRRAARRARLDEVRHARATTAMARRFGAEPETPRVTQLRPRERFQFALDNAVEGCVKEAFGALLAQVQAEQAADPEIAAMMRDIAREETEHAAFSWELAAWIEASLTPEQRTQIDAARAEALQELASMLERRFEPAVEHLAGMPTPERARALLAEMAPHLAAA